MVSVRLRSPCYLPKLKCAGRSSHSQMGGCAPPSSSETARISHDFSVIFLHFLYIFFFCFLFSLLAKFAPKFFHKRGRCQKTFDFRSTQLDDAYGAIEVFLVPP